MSKGLKFVAVLVAAISIADGAPAADPVTITFSDWKLSETPWIR
ncbi:hypothetical protein X743_30175 [Mesorhizobium sp. LNHC252B00]|nr:hypothetical protein [Mesorhizobium sp. LNHC252B00]ESY64928.1 hypothetical protein X743_30175 [Mesorhizobium sp. LNHC252B00]